MAQGSDPTDASDGGNPPPAGSILELPFSIYGDYASWEMIVSGISVNDSRVMRLSTSAPGGSENVTLKLRKGCSYRITMHWLKSKQPSPLWYCWEAKVGGLPTEATFNDYSNIRKTGVAETLTGNGWFADNTGGLLTSHVHMKSSGGGNVAGSLSTTLYIPKVEMAMDGDRDGEIGFDDPDDKSYLFWVNDDCDIDRLNTLENMWQQDDIDPNDTSHRDWEDNFIGNRGSPGEGVCERDLEDFTRLHIKVDTCVANMKGVTYWLRFDNWEETAPPSVNVFQAVDTTADYLKSEARAAEQIMQVNLTPEHVWLKEVPVNEVYISRSGVSSFLLEGCLPGTADLTFVVRKDGIEVCTSAVRLTLKKIKYFYDVYSVSASGERWNVEVAPAATHSQTAEYQPKTDEKFLFVHGWNVEGWEKYSSAETAFKRLWWQGYQGSFALFVWPTQHGFSAWTIPKHMQHFDNSEFIAWLSSDALAGLMWTLNTSGNMRVLAHSMGNIVVGEALSKYTGNEKVHTYIATQAALSAHYYDSAIAVAHPCGHQDLDQSFPDTPDIIGHFASGQAESGSYLMYVGMNVRNMQNWFNEEDFALNLWEANSVLKPDSAVDYLFRYSGRENTYWEPQDHFFGGPKIEDVPLSVTNERERYMIFTYAVESRSRALGQTANGKFNNWNLHAQIADGGMGYDWQHYSHSREFRSHISAESKFWERVFTTCKFLKP